jgi:ferredoxin-NADP reductase
MSYFSCFMWYSLCYALSACGSTCVKETAMASVSFLMLTFYSHVAIFNGEYNPYILPCVGVWVFDRALRLGRLGYLNFFKFQASAKYNKDADIVHVTVPVRGLLRPRAGTYYFLYSLNGLKFWESHPFTLMSWQTVQAENTKDSIHELSFLFRPRDSFTARLRNHVSQKSDNHNEAGTSQLQIRVAVEGPYGHPFDVSHYPSVLMVVGGTGVTVALSHIRMLHEIVERSGMSGIPIRRVQLVWAVRHLSIFEDIYQHELLSWGTSVRFSSQIKLDIEIYVTGNDGSTPALSATKDAKIEEFSQANLEASGIDDKGNAASKFPVLGDTDSTTKITVVYHRPPVQSLVQRCAEEWLASDRKMAVICCGPGSMTDDARAGVVSSIAKGYDGIDFFPEAFHW